MKHVLEVRTTISPTPFFFRRVHFLAASLRELGGALADHEIVVSVGGGEFENYYRSQPWSNLYPLIWRHVDMRVYRRLGYRATNFDRAAHLSRAEFVMMADADVIFLKSFAELLANLRVAPAIAGVMAHVSPFTAPPTLRPDFVSHPANDGSDAGYWRLLAEQFGAGELNLDQQYSGWGAMSVDEGHRYAPHYFNGGMVLGPAPLMDQMCALFEPAEDAVDAVMDTYFRPQLARTLACAKAKLACTSLSVRYNFPNDPGFENHHAAEAPEASILHYLRKEIVHRDTDFADQASVDRLIARTDLTGANEQLRKRVAQLRDIVFAEEAQG